MKEGACSFPITDHDLANAIADGALRLVYQPKLCLASDDVTSVEALSRWPQEGYGFIPPTVFVPLAERRGLIDRLTFWAIETALDQWLQWQDQGLFLKIAVNISAVNLDHGDFPDRVHDLCAQRGVPCEFLIIELTESATQQAVRLMESITRFRLKGFAVSLDDFGTGNATLAQLQRLPFSEIKIDKCFVSEAARSADSRSIIELVIALARQLELIVTAEGVEDEATLDLMRRLGCDQAQGFHIGRPMSGEAVLDWHGTKYPPPLKARSGPVAPLMPPHRLAVSQ
jgi:EAL domain-containing protein (putative c-di-GMP-specific phosphodiesterase class I)